jgi:predicted GIY-YIG superfamily endonuclease
MYYVYILLNDSKTRTYTGVTSDVDKRLGEHNAGRVKSSNPYRPHKVIYHDFLRWVQTCCTSFSVFWLGIFKFPSLRLKMA